MYQSPYYVGEIEFSYISDAAQYWADCPDAIVTDSNGDEVPPEDLESILGW